MPTARRPAAGNPQRRRKADETSAGGLVVRTEDDRELRSGAGADGDCTVTGEYVRGLEAGGRELGYWTRAERRG